MIDVTSIEITRWNGIKLDYVFVKVLVTRQYINVFNPENGFLITQVPRNTVKEFVIKVKEEN